MGDKMNFRTSEYFEDPFLKILPKLDLHGETRDVIKFLIEDFLRANIIMGNYKVQIVHGRHGTVLKKKTKEILEKCPYVVRFYLYTFNDGVTIVELDPNYKKDLVK